MTTTETSSKTAGAAHAVAEGGGLVPAETASRAVVRRGSNAPEIVARRRRRRRFAILQMVALVLVPTLIAAVYYGFLASRRYVSETYLMVSDNGRGGDALAGSVLGAIGLGGAVGASSETQMLYEYLTSPDVVEKLDESLDLRAIYGAEDIDVLSRLPADASREELTDYVLDHIAVIGEPNQPVLKVRVDAFSAEEANAVLTQLVLFSEDMLNNAFERKRTDTVAFAKRELADAEQRLARARDHLTVFRQQHGEIDPIQGAQSTSGLVASLAQKLASERVKLDGMLSYFKPESPQVVKQKAVIAALEKQLRIQRESLAGDDTSRYTGLLAEYQNLLIEQQFAEAAYTAAMAFLEQSRNDAQQQKSYIVTFVPPTLPEEATEPNVLKAVLTVFVGALLIYAIVSLTVATIREQARL